MNQALYAHMNNKRKLKKKKLREVKGHLEHEYVASVMEE
jgi:hypothetical protein